MIPGPDVPNKQLYNEYITFTYSLNVNKFTNHTSI